MNHFKRTITLFGVVAALAAVPATAHALDDGPAGPSGCYVTDSDGYEIPIHNGESVFVDGKIYSCRDGKVIVTTPPSREVDGGSTGDQVAACRARVLRRVGTTRRLRVSRRAATLACTQAVKVARVRAAS